jgi:hypothetical protein
MDIPAAPAAPTAPVIAAGTRTEDDGVVRRLPTLQIPRPLLGAGSRNRREQYSAGRSTTAPPTDAPIDRATRAGQGTNGTPDACVPPRSEVGIPRQRQEEYAFVCSGVWAGCVRAARASPLVRVRAAPFLRASDAGREGADSVDFFM